MAEVKRPNAADRIATPRIGSQSGSQPAGQLGSEHLKTLSSAIGARIKISTSASPAQTLEGTLFTACPTFNVVALDTAAGETTSGPRDFHIIPISRIQSLQVLSLAPTAVGEAGFAAALPPVQKVDAARLQERLEKRVAEVKRDEGKKGKGVSAEAQALFYALDKMFSTRWHEADIIVNDAVRVSPPYTSESCAAPKGKEQVLAHIRKVVEGERRKFADRSRGASPLPRKGG